MAAVLNIVPEDAPDFIASLLCCMLFKLGGQLTLTMGEIQEIHAQFPSIRFALSQDHNSGDVLKECLTATLRSRDHFQNDRPHTQEMM